MIRAPQVRLIDQDGTQVGIVSIQEALQRAQEAGVDLIEVAPNANPPVCRILDYKKMLYEQKRRAREARKKQKNIEVKEVKMRVNIDQHDYETKIKHAQEFLTAGDKVKITIMFRGRQMDHPELGERLIKQVIQDLEPVGAVEGPIPRHGRIMSFYMAAKQPSQSSPGASKPTSGQQSGSSTNAR
ncbi:MAG: translation initiation factor IF-3 [Candidatus Sumerlaeia bacterium]